MRYSLNETHNPDASSWVASANADDTDFPIQNLPFGVFRRRGSDDPARVGVAIGREVLDLAAAHHEGLFHGRASRAADACLGSSLNPLMALAPADWSALRQRVFALLDSRHPDVRAHRAIVPSCMASMTECDLLLPASIGDYTDFYASIHHATNVGRMVRPDQPLFPNYRHLPIGYHGRASSIVVSGTAVVRPWGQWKTERADVPVFEPSRRLDYELEVGFFVGGENSLGEPVAVESAASRLFGACLLNDWSARDIQAWEYQPLGPFLGKSFATTISPWVVTLEALEPYRVACAARADGEPGPMRHLDDAIDGQRGAIDVSLEAWISTAQMRAAGQPPWRVSASRLRDLYWTPAQLVAHQASNGCNLRSGDLIATWTVSGPEPESRSCLLERTWRGQEPLVLPTGETRAFLHDGDEVEFRGAAMREGFARVGLGRCVGRISPSVARPGVPAGPA